MANKILSSQNIIKRTGITARQLDHWCTREYIPEADINPGTGQTRFFSWDQLEFIQVMKELIEIGVSPEKASQLTKKVLEEKVYLVQNNKVLVTFVLKT